MSNTTDPWLCEGLAALAEPTATSRSEDAPTCRVCGRQMDPIPSSGPFVSWACYANHLGPDANGWPNDPMADPDDFGEMDDIY